jgi:hypothetical protein
MKNINRRKNARNLHLYERNKMKKCLSIVMLEFDKKNSPRSDELAKKYQVPVSEIWKGYARLTAGRGK